MMDESLLGFLCLGTIGVVVIVAWRNSAAHQKEQKEQFRHQQKILEAWAAERFGPGEVSEAAKN